MEVRKGYKQTELGILPDEWEVYELRDIVFTLQLGGNYANSESLTDYPLMKMGNMSRGEMDLSKIEYILNGHKVFDRDRLKFGDLLFNTRNTLDLVGKVAIWRSELPVAYFNSNIMRIEFDEKKVSSNFYMNYTFNSKACLDSLRSLATGTTSVAAIYTRDLLKLKLALPTRQEQTAIAQVLSDTDELISSLEKLIEKKKQIKQATMQQLLTGKKRLPGFSGKWRMESLGKLGAVYGGLSGKSKIDFENGDTAYIPFLNIMNNPVIDVSYFDYVKIKSNENQNKAMKGDLFFNGSSETPEEVGMCSVLMDDIPNLYLNSFCFGFRLFSEKETNGLYLSYFFRSSIGRKLFYSLAQGATRHNLPKTSFLKIEFPIPTPDEQVAIANLISDMNSEIESLEQKLNKYKSIKQGMMQNLLTGKIRLV